MNGKLQMFLTTQNFESAWRCYQDWCAFQKAMQRTGEVGFAGCRVNGKNCWEIQITQELHDERVRLVDQYPPYFDSGCQHYSAPSLLQNLQYLDIRDSISISVQKLLTVWKQLPKQRLWAFPLMACVTLEPWKVGSEEEIAHRTFLFYSRSWSRIEKVLQ